MIYYGIDLTDIRLCCHKRDGTQSEFVNIPFGNSVVLPFVEQEKLILGQVAQSHRRGQGFEWPPESQMPYASDCNRGYGRVLLTQAWLRMLPSPGSENCWGHFNDEMARLTWNPDSVEISERAESIIMKTSECIVSPDSAFGKMAFVVPDHLDEAAQQKLLDEHRYGSRLHLVPRSLALATQWCAEQDVSKVASKGDGERSGLLYVLSAGSVSWDLILLDIRKEKGQLVPIRDQAISRGALHYEGMTFILMLLQRMYPHKKTFDLWQILLDPKELELAETMLIEGAGLSSEELHEMLSVSLDDGIIEWLNGHIPTDRKLSCVGSVIKETFKQLKIRLNDLQNSIKDINKHDGSDDILGCIVDGFGMQMKHPSTSAVSIGHYLAHCLGVRSDLVTVSTGGAAIGASLVAQQLVEELPVYREYILPIHIVELQKNKFDEPMYGEVQLIKRIAAPAGKMISSVGKELKEFQILKGEQKITLFLNRPRGEKNEYRKVDASMEEPLVADTIVNTRYEVSPGQGFAKVTVESTDGRTFNAPLDWRTMTDAEEPKFSEKKGYVPGRALIQACEYSGQYDFISELDGDAIDAFNDAVWHKNYKNLKPLIDDVRDNINKWQIKDAGKQVFVNSIASHDTLGHRYREKLEELQRSIEALLTSSKMSGWHRDLIRLSGWMYEAAPDKALDLCRVALRRNLETDAHLQLIGNCFRCVEDVQLFIRSWEQAPQLKLGYIRALRNILRFYPTVINSDYISNKSIYMIEEHFREECVQYLRSEGTYHPNFIKEIVRMFPYFLKRRIYDTQFLAESDKLFGKWSSILKGLIKGYSDSSVGKLAALSLKFLETNADEGTIATLVQMQSE